MECQLDTFTMHYETFGQGRPLLLLPGWTMSARTHAHVMEPLLQERRGWQRIYIDPPGHGRTSGSSSVTNLDQMVDLLLACIDQIIPGQTFALHGYSLGAYLARAILLHRPQAVSGISQLAPVVFPVRNQRRLPAAVVLVEDPQVMASLTAEEGEMMEIVVVRNQAMLDEIRAWPVPGPQEGGDPDYLQEITEDPRRYTCTYAVDALARPFERPALIVAARQDFVVGYEDAWTLLDNYPRASFVVFDRAGHLMDCKLPLFGSLLNEWLDRVEEEDPIP